MADLLHCVGGKGPDEEVVLPGRLPIALTARAVREEGELLAVGRPGGMGGVANSEAAAGWVADGVGRDNPFRCSGLRCLWSDAGQVQFEAARPAHRPGDGPAVGRVDRGGWGADLVEVVEESGDAGVFRGR